MRHLVLLGLLSLPAAAQEGGIEIFAGETLFESGWRVSLTELYKPRRDLFRGSDDVADPLARESLEIRSIVGIDYGLDRSVQLSLLVPHVYREEESGGSTLRASGLGDLAFLTKYRFLQHEGRAESFNWAVIAGIELPTGETREFDRGARLAPSLQPGSGAWSPFVATAATRGLGRARFDAVLLYKANTEGAQQLQRGNFASVEVSAAYRFIHVKYPGPTVGARLGVQWRHESRSEQAGVALANSGADEVLLKPALSVHPIPAMDLNLGARIPVYQHYHGEQLGRDIEFSLAIGFRF